MTESNQYKKQRWKFLLVGLFLSSLTIFSNPNPDLQPSVVLGKLFGGAFWGWFVWLLWAKAYRLALIVAACVGLLVGWSVFAGKNTPLDIYEITKACSKNCQSQWNAQRDVSTSPAYKMGASEIQGLCDCVCETSFKSMGQDLLKQLRTLTSDQVASNMALKSTMEQSLQICYPKFSKVLE